MSKSREEQRAADALDDLIVARQDGTVNEAARALWAALPPDLRLALAQTAPPIVASETSAHRGPRCAECGCEVLADWPERVVCHGCEPEPTKPSSIPDEASQWMAIDISLQLPIWFAVDSVCFEVDGTVYAWRPDHGPLSFHESINAAVERAWDAWHHACDAALLAQGYVLDGEMP